MSLLKLLRNKWGKESFDVAWKEATETDMADLLNDQDDNSNT